MASCRNDEVISDDANERRFLEMFSLLEEIEERISTTESRLQSSFNVARDTALVVLNNMCVQIAFFKFIFKI